jgi:type I restriction enzyme, S subunit
MTSNDWKEVQLKDVILFNPRESIKKGTMAKKISMDKLAPYQKKITGFDYAEFKSGTKFKNGDTLLARITPCLENGKTAQVDILDDNEIGFGSTEFIVMREISGISDNDFIYYLAISDDFRNIAIKSMTGTSGRQRVQMDVLEQTKLLIPPLREQKAIANILSTLDEKIETNNQINEKLEEMAQALFKHWFVDFEFPNENGEPYKSSGGEMVESELGMIPKGWEVGTIKDIGEVVGGGTPSKKKNDYYTSNGIPWITPKDLSGFNKRYIKKGSIDITHKGYKNSSAKMLPKGSVLFSSRAPIGYIAIASNEVTTNQGFKSVIPFENFGTEFVFQTLKSNLETIKNRASGSTFKEISGGELKKIEVILPPQNVVDKFNQRTKQIGELIAIYEEQNERLEKLRDTLLPKLMSREIRVPLDDEVLSEQN